jgi:beta-lactamase class A
LHRLVLGEILPMDLRAQLRQWMLGSRTGALRIKAGIPPDWIIGDKTGTGQYGSANDIAVLWPPGRRPLVLAVYTRQHRQQAAANEAVIAAAARIVVDSLG